MRITKYIHACLLVEEGDARVLFDPGRFSFIEGAVDPNVFQDLSAIIITHQHPDHIDDNALNQIVGNNPSATVITNRQVQQRLAGLGLAAEVFEDGSRNIAGFNLKAVRAEHADILNAEKPTNIAYTVNGRMLNPGDSFENSLDVFKGIQLLALPTMAPWNTELQVAEFARRISPERVIPIHDGYAKEFFLKQRYEAFGKYFGEIGIEFKPLLKPGDAIDIPI